MLRRTVRAVTGVLFAAFLVAFLLTGRPALAEEGQVALLNAGQRPISSLTDGDAVYVKLTLAAKATEVVNVSFHLDDGGAVVGGCTIARGSQSCQSERLLALGWRWDVAGQERPQRRVVARVAGLAESPVADVAVAPRPVVLVHGLTSNAGAWQHYAGAEGFLASLGLRAFAVGDGQAGGVLNTGSFSDPNARTNTLAQNAQILKTYIAGVKKATGAQQVDLIGHSLGGLISRYYVARVMDGRDVAQMITMGSPHLGSDCAGLAGSLGFYIPATLEVRPGYMQQVFNPQVWQQRGVPFYTVAGARFANPVQTLCTNTPHDMYVSLASATGIPAQTAQAAATHSELIASRNVFEAVVSPLLRQAAGRFAAPPDRAPAQATGETLQFTRVFTGVVPSGGSVDHTVHIDSVAVASFALFDPTGSLTVTVRGATGNVINLQPDTHGLIVVDDPAALAQLGYGFNNPRPGPWGITLRSTARTPATGAPYAIMAQLRGGAQLAAQASNLFPKLSEPVELSARLELGGQALAVREATAFLRGAGGKVETIALVQAGDAWRATWRPGAAGVQGIDVTVSAQAPDGLPIERTVFLTLDVQPEGQDVRTRQIAIGGALVVLLVGIVAVAWRLVRRLRRSGRGKP